jgi:hypothetical protein
MTGFTFKVGTQVYRLIEQAKSWDAANSYASGIGGHLATIDSASENAAVYAAIAHHLTVSTHSVPVSEDGGGAAYLWLGLNDIAQEGNYVWSDGSKSTFRNWGKGTLGAEPDNAGNQDAVGLALEGWPRELSGALGTAAQWNDIDRASQLWSIVEFNAFAKTAGTELNDVIAAPAGHADIDARAGRDTVTLAGSRASFTVSKTGDGFLVYDGNGILNLSGVERLQFSDGMTALDLEGSAGQAYRLYRAAFDRTPDLEGLGFWIKAMDNGQVLEDVSREFIRSPEFARLYGTNVSNNDFLTKLYENILDRKPDADGYKFWLDALNGGTSREHVLAQFSESPENKAALVGVLQDGFAYVPYLG